MLSDAEQERILDDVRTRAPYKVIAARHGVSMSYICELARSRGIKRYRRGRPRDDSDAGLDYGGGGRDYPEM